ncbi:MAG TPA: energy transducer TonB [Anaeromyxobacter sp.]|nr:energy transducer TonB [Anaeromyxobacter sp.]
MGIPVATAFGRRDRLWPAVVFSAAAHVVLAGWAVVRRAPPEIDLDQKPIVARLVRLGEKRPEELLPRKEAPPPPPAPPAPMVAPAAPSAPARPAAPAPGAPPAKAGQPSTGRSGTTLASVLSKVQRDVDEERWGSPDGDPMGDSETGSEGDRYLALVVRELQSNHNVFRTLSESEAQSLRATVVLRIDANGRILGHAFERRSGNASYDAALERAIQKSRLPPPPAALRERFRTAGLGVNFHL